MTEENDALARAGALAGDLPGLLLQAEKVAQSFMRGVHGRRRVGGGEAFWQFRPYQAGDARRDIDWRQTAKRERAFVRQTEWEAAQTVWLYRDPSASMDFRSSPGLPAKKDYAELLLLALGIVLLSGGEQVSLLGTGLAPQIGYPAIRRLYDALPAQDSLAENGRAVAARAQAILFSDFYFPPEDLATFCERLAARQVGGMLVQVFDPAEQSLPYSGRIRFQDMEDAAGTLDIAEVDGIRGVYEEKFRAHQQRVAAIAAGCGWKFAAFATDAPPEEALTRLYGDLASRAA